MNHSDSNSFSSGELPSYKNPPINEVVCGLRFQPLDKLRIPHIGLLWDKFRIDYPVIQHAPPIASAKGELLIDQTTGLPIQRVWFINASDDQLVQFQFDRFYFNWRRRQGVYPRYTNLIKHFEKTLNTINSFFKEFEIGELNPIEYELSYINHIPKGEGWDTIEDLPKILSDFNWERGPERFLPNPVTLAWKSEFLLQKKMGRLFVTLNQATRIEDKVPLFVLELRAHGIDESADLDTCLKWFDVAHEWIVRGFTDITTPEVHRIWEREK